MNAKVKATLRDLALCDHPIESMRQAMDIHVVAQWCCVCGAVRILANGTLNQWCRSRCAMVLTEQLVDGALKAEEDGASPEAEHNRAPATEAR
jgi:hypothetical protein